MTNGPKMYSSLLMKILLFGLSLALSQRFNLFGACYI
jgi:hypothetical protein